VPASRILILTASIGEGHDLPARVLGAGLLARRPDAEVVIVDGLPALGRVLSATAGGGARVMSWRLQRALDLEYLVFVRPAPVRALGQAIMARLGAPGLARLVADVAPDVVVSTYPATTEVLGWLRERGRLDVPAVSAITDLSSLWFWARRGVDVHLITHPESAAEVRAIAGPTRVEAVRGLYDPAMLEPIAPAAARRELALPADGPIVIVSGGGWAVGDLPGGVAAALGAEREPYVVALCGRNEEVARALRARFGASPRLRVEGFTERMSAFLAAGDVLVHASAGLTVLEGLIRGCRVISYGWNVAHVSLNNRAFERFGLATVVRSRRGLPAALREALANPGSPDLSFAALPDAADVVLELADAARPSEKAAR
jgi:processive 1,2-diacylglycerol beta-glucosyltransferase